MKFASLTTIVLAGAMLAGCVMTEDVVSLQYTSTQSGASVRGAQQVGATVVTVDARPTDATKISDKIDGYGNKQGPVRTDTDISALVRSAAENELSSRGFRMAGNDATVRIEILRFFNEFRRGFPMAIAEGQVGFNVQVLDRGASALYQRRINVVNRAGNVAFVTAGVAKSNLEDSLGKAMNELMADERFIDAIIAAGKS